MTHLGQNLPIAAVGADFRSLAESGHTTKQSCNVGDSPQADTAVGVQGAGM